MGSLHLAHRMASRATGAAARVLQLSYLPTRLNGIWLRTPVQSWESLVRTYEPYIADVLRQHLTPGDCLVDVGAHFGLWSLFAARLVGPTGRVIACEPSPAFEVLERAACSYSWIEAVHIGVGDRESTACFHAQGSSTSGSFVREVTDINQRFAPAVPVTEESVRIRTLDGLMNELGCRPTIVKLDIEGFELNALRGAREVLASPALWIIEVHPPQLALSGGSEEELSTLLADNGYHTYVIDRNPNSLCTIVAKKGVRCQRA
jgi:FkbM family methyltransferase